MYMKSSLMLILLISSVVISGCIGQQTQEMPIDKSVEAMKNLMQNHPEMMNTTNAAIVKEDQAFSGNNIKKGNFENINYMTSGSVNIEEIDGKKYVMLGEDFSTPSGPNLVLYLTKNSGKTTRDDIRNGVELKELKSTKGKQVYEIPANVDISQYNSVTIHCKAFNVPWSYAKLQ